jgi:hypothetical protein
MRKRREKNGKLEITSPEIVLVKADIRRRSEMRKGRERMVLFRNRLPLYFEVLITSRRTVRHPSSSDSRLVLLVRARRLGQGRRGWIVDAHLPANDLSTHRAPGRPAPRVLARPSPSTPSTILVAVHAAVGHSTVMPLLEPLLPSCTWPFKDRRDFSGPSRRGMCPPLP